MINRTDPYFKTFFEIFDMFDLSIELGSDFAKYHRATLADRSHQPVAAAFDADLHDLNEANAFWLLARDAAGKVIHTQAIRVVDLNGLSVGDYLRANLMDFRPPHGDFIREKSAFMPGPYSRELFGKSCYHGEIWIDGESKGFRNTGLSSVFTRLTMSLGHMMFSPDVMWGFVAQGNALYGLIEKIGYFHREQTGIRLYDGAHERALHGQFCFMRRDDLDFMLTLPIRDIIDDYANNTMKMDPTAGFLM